MRNKLLRNKQILTKEQFLLYTSVSFVFSYWVSLNLFSIEIIKNIALVFDRLAMPKHLLYGWYFLEFMGAEEVV